MNSAVPVVAPAVADALPKTATALLEADARWNTASESERAVLKRIAMQRDRLAAAQQAKLQTLSLKAERDSVPVDAPFAERLMVFAKLHPVATAGVVGVALMIGPRKLMRWGAIALPLLAKFKR